MAAQDLFIDAERQRRWRWRQLRSSTNEIEKRRVGCTKKKGHTCTTNSWGAWDLERSPPKASSLTWIETHTKKEVEKQQRVKSKVMKLFKEYSASILPTSANLSTYFSFNSSLLPLRLSSITNWYPRRCRARRAGRFPAEAWPFAMALASRNTSPLALLSVLGPHASIRASSTGEHRFVNARFKNDNGTWQWVHQAVARAARSKWEQPKQASSDLFDYSTSNVLSSFLNLRSYRGFS